LEDKFSLAKRAMLKSKRYLDLTQVTSVQGFIIEGTEPPGSRRRFIFEVDGNLEYFEGNAQQIFNYPLTVENVLEYGNSAEELFNVGNLACWVGKKIYPIIALENDGADVEPKVKFGVKASSFNEIYSQTKDSPIYELESGRILSLSAEKVTSGQGVLNVRARTRLTGAWDDWQELAEINYKDAEAVQFRTQYKVTTLEGSDSCKLDKVEMRWQDRTAKVGASAIYSERFSLPEKILHAKDQPIFDDDIYVSREEIKQVTRGDYQPVPDGDAIQRSDIDRVMVPGVIDFTAQKTLSSYVLIDHSRLEGVTLRGYYTELSEPKHGTANLGEADGTEQSFQLDVAGIDINSLCVQADGENIIPLSYDTGSGLIVVQARHGKILTAEFDYNVATENWHEMQTYFTDDRQTLFTYTTSTPSRLVAFKVVAEKKQGIVHGESGAVEILPCVVYPEDIIKAETWKLSDCGILTGEVGALSYSWRGEDFQIYSVRYGFI